MKAPEQIKISYNDIDRFVENGALPDGYDIVFRNRLTGNIFAQDSSKIFQDIDANLAGHDWTRSFDRPQVLTFCQEYTPQTLRVLQQWLRYVACNITSIILVSTHHTGLKRWWYREMDHANEKTFGIIEWLDIREIPIRKKYHDKLCTINIDRGLEQRQYLDRYFTWYGGSPTMEKFYETLCMMPVADLGYVEMLETATISKKAMVNHANYVSYFNTGHCNEIEKWYNMAADKIQICSISQEDFVASRGNQVHHDKIDYQGYQWQKNRTSFAAVVRETTNYLPFCSVTEKTVRAFVHGQAVMPLGYRSVEDLEALGFWFPHDLIDYNYQHEQDYQTRLAKMVIEIDKLAKNYSLACLFDYWKQNLVRFRQNAQTCVDYALGKI